MARRRHPSGRALPPLPTTCQLASFYQPFNSSIATADGLARIEGYLDRKSKGCFSCGAPLAGPEINCGPCALDSKESCARRREAADAAEIAEMEEAMALAATAPIHVILDTRRVVRGESAELGPDGAKVWFRV
ncbi:hypothetical protein TSOC_000076 [Tetrabaena socialis]|uniref:Uncharacterized protein n=1 Tax=Tetrabaena socialis TaxID=47790 RepID=A0A2J8AKE9_9CHLO|nr:hypothetical protein TSOC_000076 [Tetrabaena socialis]|eukprot:PNH12992.1 hypothetical protein TSOC_000076 [Tetrabaena socialis]